MDCHQLLPLHASRVSHQLWRFGLRLRSLSPIRVNLLRTYTSLWPWNDVYWIYYFHTPVTSILFKKAAGLESINRAKRVIPLDVRVQLWAWLNEHGLDLDSPHTWQPENKPDFYLSRKYESVEEDCSCGCCVGRVWCVSEKRTLACCQPFSQ